VAGCGTQRGSAPAHLARWISSHSCLIAGSATPGRAATTSSCRSVVT